MAKHYRIRKLTPTECLRLMGVSDEDIAKMKAAGISDSQLYKLAGNSIVVNVLVEIFRRVDFGKDKLRVFADQGFVNDVNKAIQKYQKRLEKGAKVVEDADEEKIALEGEKALQERIEMSPKERRKADRETERRFKETVKKAETE